MRPELIYIFKEAFSNSKTFASQHFRYTALLNFRYLKMPCSGVPDLTFIFNLQPHIDEIREGLVGTKEHTSEDFTFMLQHKHFDISPGEVLYVEKVDDKRYNVKVKNRDTLGVDSSPCMWLYNSGWKPFGYTKCELGYDKVPPVAPGGYNLGVRWLNNGGTEWTDEDKRLQWVRQDREEGKAIVTLVNWVQHSDCESDCFPTCCVTPVGGSRLHFPPRHIVYHIPDQEETEEI